MHTSTPLLVHPTRGHIQSCYNKDPRVFGSVPVMMHQLHQLHQLHAVPINVPPAAKVLAPGGKRTEDGEKELHKARSG